MIGALAAVAAVAYWAKPSLPSTSGTPQAVHRILLPDWVSPGEWFALDAGPKANQLAVYFGNQKATTKLQADKLMVQTPADLPSEKTTISVFEQDQSSPMMTQATHIVRPRLLASAVKPSTTGPTSLEAAPSNLKLQKVEIPTIPAPGVKTDNQPGKTAPSLPKPPTAGSPSKPAAQPPVKSTDGKVEVTRDLLTQSNLDEIGRALEDDPGQDEGNAEPAVNVGEVVGPARNTVIAIRSAKSGNQKLTLSSIQEARKELSKVPPELRLEIEAALKAAEAIAADHQSKKQFDGKAMAKWADAFAFNMNNGTRGFTGIAMVRRMIDAGRKDDARRALELIEKRPDLSGSERTALDKLRKRIDSSQ
jgi:hypothetical protein